MDTIFSIWNAIGSTFLTIILFVSLFYVAKVVLDRQAAGKADWGIIRSIILFLIGIIGMIAVILAIPMSPELKGQITSLMGIVISAVLALSSATLIGNGLAGIMLRIISNFKPGDFITINDNFGRVTERGLFHTEIQTENRDLLTLPNMYLSTNPVKVTRSSGTFVCGVCSLGYDVSRHEIEKTLLEAARRAELTDPFIRITELGDFSVVYKVYGLVKDIKTLLSASSRLNGHMLDTLHEAGIEIVSPNFMNQRQVGEQIFIPKKVRVAPKEKKIATPESLIFDKAEEAETIEKRKANLADIEEKLAQLSEALKAEKTTEEKEKIAEKIKKWEEIKQKMIDKLDQQVDELSKKK